MTDSTTLQRFIDGYVRAWRSNSPDDIRAIFTDDAEYRYEPYSEPLLGRDAIASSWIERQDEAGTWSFDWTLVAVDADVAVVEGRTVYEGEKTYRNLWVIRLSDDGRASSFTEWYMAEED